MSKGSGENLKKHPEAQVRWELSDLKALKKRAMNFHAEEALPRIRVIAQSFFKDSSDTTPKSVEASLRELLFRHNPAARVLCLSDGLVKFRAIPLSQLPKLPKGYGFKGGAARLTLKAILGQQIRNLRPRDLDLVRVGLRSDVLDRDLARAYMPDDYQHGYGIETLEDVSSYFHTRDLTVNEVLLFSDELLCTRAAIEDTLSHTIRTSAHLKDNPHLLTAMTKAKMLRFYSEDLARGVSPFLEEIEGLDSIDPFFLQIQYQRALQQDSHVADIFLDVCRSRNLRFEI